MNSQLGGVCVQQRWHSILIWVKLAQHNHLKSPFTINTTVKNCLTLLIVSYTICGFWKYCWQSWFHLVENFDYGAGGSTIVMNITRVTAPYCVYMVRLRSTMFQKETNTLLCFTFHQILSLCSRVFSFWSLNYISRNLCTSAYPGATTNYQVWLIFRCWCKSQHNSEQLQWH